MKHSPVPIPGRAPEGAVQSVTKDGETRFRVADHRGKYIVLVFYSGDWECRESILAFDALLDRYKKEKCEVFACSSDSAKAHQSWIKTPSEDGGFGGSLRVPLLSDTTGAVGQQYDVFDPEEGTCRNAVVIIDDTGVVRHAMTTSLNCQDTAQNCLDIIAMLKQHKLSDTEIRNINAAASNKKREKSRVRVDRGEIEKAWDISQDEELNKVLNIARLLGKTAPPPTPAPTGEPKFDISNDQIARLMNPRVPVRACRVSLYRNLAGYGMSELAKAKKQEIETAVKRIMGVAHMPEDLTGCYNTLANLNQRELNRFFDTPVFYNSGDVRLREPGAVKWSEGSGVFINNYNNFLLWVNFTQQLRLVAMEEGHDVRSAILRLKRGVEKIEEALKAVTKRGFNISRQRFVHNEKGVMAAGFDISFLVEFPGFVKEGDSQLKALGIKQGITVQKYGRSGTVYDCRVSQKEEDDVWSIIRRGIIGLGALWTRELELQEKHNVKLTKEK